MKKFVLMILVCCLLPILYGCGSDDEDENTDTGTVITSAESAFFYKYTPQNIETPFYAYSNTEFTINLSGNCDYQFDLLTEDKKSYSTVATGLSETKPVVTYMNLSAGNYLLNPDVVPINGSVCEWSINIKAMFSDNQGCCSGHGGVAICGNNGKIVCQDGWTGSSCDCSRMPSENGSSSSSSSSSSGSSVSACPDSCDLQGCCSGGHGGVAGCTINGMVICNDNSISPTCTCP